MYFPEWLFSGKFWKRACLAVLLVGGYYFPALTLKLTGDDYTLSPKGLGPSLIQSAQGRIQSIATDQMTKNMTEWIRTQSKAPAASGR